MKMANMEIRKAAKRAGVKLWEVAAEFGFSDSYFSRKLRKEFSDEEKQKALEVIKRLRLEHEQEE